MIPTGESRRQLEPRSPPQGLQKTASGASFNATSSQSASIKGQLQALDDIIRQLREEEAVVTKEVQRLRAEKDTSDNELNHQTADSRSMLQEEVTAAEEEMQRHIASQKAENSRLQIQITQLKTDKANLQDQIIALTKRVQDIENSLGHERPS